eukprot:3833775-Alexandrium_andersonii.AAC.1
MCIRDSYIPQSPDDFGFNLGDVPPCNTGVPTRDVRYDKIVYGVWISALRWVVAKRMATTLMEAVPVVLSA